LAQLGQFLGVAYAEQVRIASPVLERFREQSGGRSIVRQGSRAGLQIVPQPSQGLLSEVGSLLVVQFFRILPLAMHSRSGPGGSPVGHLPVWVGIAIEGLGKKAGPRCVLLFVDAT